MEGMYIQDELFSDLVVDSNEIEDASKSEGAVFTKSEVVCCILNLIGYESSKALYKQRILEPSCGDGSFIRLIIERLLQSYHAHNESSLFLLSRSLRAVEKNRNRLELLKREVIRTLEQDGFSENDSIVIANEWFVCGDFLLCHLNGQFDYVVGNPPYVRVERIPQWEYKRYRDIYHTFRNRADLYIPFYERGLSLLSDTGKLGFICTDRWLKNKYGQTLRAYVAQSYNLCALIEVNGSEAFCSDVTTYPAITVFERKTGNLIKKESRTYHAKLSLNELNNINATEGNLISIVNEGLPWIVEKIDDFQFYRSIELNLPTIEDAGCKIGIGVATGADRVFVGNVDELPVEDSRKLPLAMTKDIKDGNFIWGNRAMVNPYDDNGNLVDLNKYPQLKLYLEKHETHLRARHCAKKTPSKWYKTIDRIYPNLQGCRKLLIPDIKSKMTVVIDDGELYPHHNFYYILPGEWDIYALRAFLVSEYSEGIINRFCTKMNGGTMRFQAQFLRRLRIPRWKDLSFDMQHSLIVAGVSNDLNQINVAVNKCIESFIV